MKHTFKYFRTLVLGLAVVMAMGLGWSQSSVRPQGERTSIRQIAPISLMADGQETHGKHRLPTVS